MSVRMNMQAIIYYFRVPSPDCVPEITAGTSTIPHLCNDIFQLLVSCTVELNVDAELESFWKEMDVTSFAVIEECVWNGRVKPQKKKKISARIDGNQVEIWTWDLSTRIKNANHSIVTASVV